MTTPCFRYVAVLFLMYTLSASGQTLPGAARSELLLPLLKGKLIGIVANQASVVAGVNTVDTLLASGYRIVKIFSPEHGFRSFSGAGETVSSQADSVTGLPVVSLYGKYRKPLPEDLKGLDIMVFDLQDVGVRFYTYISTMTYVMEACAEAGIPVVVLDRPNPNGFYIDGPVLEEKFRSFVGLHPVPVVYGMTIGEYAKMVNGEGWMKEGIRSDLTVVPLTEWTHHTYTFLPVFPSPNLPTMNAVYLYPSLCWFEGTDVSVGRGTYYPFEVFGHPAFKGFSFWFTPESIPGKSLHPPHEGEVCLGLDLRDFYQAHPSMFGRINLAWLMMAYRNLGSESTFFTSYFDQLAGTSTLREGIRMGLTEQQIRQGWKAGIDSFREIRRKYLLYPE